jgi:hypothetical protein
MAAARAAVAHSSAAEPETSTPASPKRAARARAVSQPAPSTIRMTIPRHARRVASVVGDAARVGAAASSAA